MKLLAVDTATRSCSVAISQDDAVVVELTKNVRKTHSKQLMELLDFALHSSKMRLAELDGFVVTRGPGSFTGLRIGISTVKGLALATAKPLVSVSCLEALTYQMPHYHHLICPMLDARRDEVYTALHRWQDQDLVQIKPETAMSPEKAVAALGEPCLFVGNGAVLYWKLILDTLKDNALIAQPWQHFVRGATVAQIGLVKMRQRLFEDVSCFGPVYLRKSDAEVNLERRARFTRT